ncbi:Ankyrin family protein [Waddlia chondrophila 2032/99]|nr:hypothetical protein [Waddlia chondrophila]CCB91819.1 Ankyrin family protein [Waddlia chondrophila 2032/99]
MFKTSDFDENINKTQKEINELEIRNGQIDRDYSDLLSKLQITSEQLSRFIEKKENFTEKNWEQLQERKKEIEQKLATDLTNIRDPLKSKKALQDRNVGSHWLFIR